MSTTSYLTPLSMVFFVFAICASYMFITSSSAKYAYIGDSKFIIFKTMMLISTIAMGYVITIASVSLYVIASKFGAPVFSIVSKVLDFTRNSAFSTLLLYMSSIWLGLAVALLPYGHTVYIAGTNNIDPSRTKQLVAVQQTVYAMPFWVLLFTMGVSLMFFIILSCFMFVGTTKPSDAILNTGATFGKALTGIRPTMGWYFRFDSDKWDKIKSGLISTTPM
jgi:hypothetical protein